MIEVLILIVLLALMLFFIGMMVGSNSTRKELAREHQIISDMYVKAADERDFLKTRITTLNGLKSCSCKNAN